MIRRPPRSTLFPYTTLVVAVGAAAALVFLLAPRLESLHPSVPTLLWAALAAAAGVCALWFALLLLSFYGGTVLLPEQLLERGPYLRLMSLTSHVARVFGKRDWVEHAAIDVYNSLAERRQRRVGKGELLVLIPRCLSKQTLDGVLSLPDRYTVPSFFANRGSSARGLIRVRLPSAMLA